MAEGNTYFIDEDNFWEVVDRAQKVKGNIDKVQGATLLEELVSSTGFMFNDPDYEQILKDAFLKNPLDDQDLAHLKKFYEATGVEFKYTSTK